MKRKILLLTICMLIFMGFRPYSCISFEIATRYATIIFNDRFLLERFNDEIFLGKYSFLLRQEGIRTMEDEVGYKIDLVIDRVQEILNLFPPGIHFKIIICASEQEVGDYHSLLYGESIDSPAFYAHDADLVFFSAEDTELTVVAHEFAHVIMKKYFQVAPPVKIHELLSRYAARHIKD